MNPNLTQIAGDAYRALDKLVISATDEDDGGDKELEIEGETLMENFQAFIEFLRERELVS